MRRNESDTTARRYLRRKTSTLAGTPSAQADRSSRNPGSSLQDLCELGAEQANATRVAAANALQGYGTRPQTLTMKALSIRQPWAWLIVNGHKPVENRSWPTKYTGKLLIHAGQRFEQK